MNGWTSGWEDYRKRETTHIERQEKGWGNVKFYVSTGRRLWCEYHKALPGVGLFVGILKGNYEYSGPDNSTQAIFPPDTRPGRRRVPG